MSPSSNGESVFLYKICDVIKFHMMEYDVTGWDAMWRDAMWSDQLILMKCDVIGFDVMWWSVTWCDVKESNERNTTLVNLILI